jgi:hypothetical protein
MPPEACVTLTAILQGGPVLAETVGHVERGGKAAQQFGLVAAAGQVGAAYVQLALFGGGDQRVEIGGIDEVHATVVRLGQVEGAFLAHRFTWKDLKLR